MIFSESTGDTSLEIFVAIELIRLVDDPNSAVKFNAESSLCRLFKLNTDTPTLPSGAVFAKISESVSALAARIKQKFKTRNLEDPEDIDLSCINL